MISVLKLAEQTRNLGEKIYMEGYILGYVFGFTKTYLIGYLSVCYDSDISCYQIYCEGWQMAMKQMSEQYNISLDEVINIVQRGYRYKINPIS